MIDQLAFLKEHFGDADGVLGLLGKHVNDVPQRPAVVKWFRRGSIPGEWLFLLIVALKRENGEWPDALKGWRQTLLAPRFAPILG